MITRHAPGLLVAGVVLLASAVSPSAFAQNYQGKEFPDFQAKDALSGKPISLSALRGKVVLVDFWATWCKPCVAEIPNVRRVYKRYAKEGLEIVSISLDSKEATFKKFMKRGNMPWLHVMEGGGWGTRLAKKYQVRSIPAMFLIDHRGVCVGQKLRGPDLERAVKRAVAAIEPGSGSGGGGSAPGDRPPGDATPGDGSADRIAQLRRDVDRAGRELAKATEPLDEIDRVFSRARRTITDLKEQLPLPERPAATKRQYLRLRANLVAARKDLFVCGGLKSAIAIPADVFADAATDREGFIAGLPELEVGTKAIATMTQRLAVLRSEFEAAHNELTAVDSRLARRPSTPTIERAETLVAEASALVENCGRSWARQIPVAHGMLDRLGAVTGGGQLDALAAAVEQTRDAARDAAIDRNRSHDGVIRAGLDRLQRELGALAATAVQRGALETGAITLPTNPLEDGSSADLRTRIEVGRQLDVASTAIATLRKAGVVGGGDASSLAERLAAIEREVGTTTDEKRLAELHRAFTVICEKLLLLADASDA